MLTDTQQPSPDAFPIRLRGRQFEDFHAGQRFRHHWGRTFCDGDATLFATVTLAYSPRYFNAERARAEGHRNLVVHPMLVLSTVVGMSVEDLSEAGGPFVGLDQVSFERPVYPGDTVTANSTVLELRESESRPAFGLVTWHTEGHNHEGDLVVALDRTNLVIKRAS